jgi:hypothetical protein
MRLPRLPLIDVKRPACNDEKGNGYHLTEKKKFTHYKDKENAGNNKKEWELG